MANLSVNLCGVTLKNPVVAASGTFGFGREYNELYDIGRLGGVSTKGLTLEPRLGNPTPRIAESRGVILNAVGLQNPGAEHFIAHDLEWLKGTGTAVIANVAGKTLEEYAAICARLDGLADMIELNISCPNVRCGGMAFGIRPESVREVTRVSKAALKKTPLMVKLSPNVESPSVLVFLFGGVPVVPDVLDVVVLLEHFEQAVHLENRFLVGEVVGHIRNVLGLGGDESVALIGKDTADLVN